MATLHSGAARLRTVDDLRGPAGRLEALLNEGAPDAPYAVLVCHPHPLGGGTMHNKVVYHAMKAFQQLALPVLRFNFRGTGLSEGEHDHGRGEQQDVHAALDWLRREYRRPLLLAGFSFGAYVGLRALCAQSGFSAQAAGDVTGAVALGLPVRAEGRGYTYGFLGRCALPKLFVSGTEDEYGPRAEVEAAVASAHPPAELAWVEGTGHFFLGKLDVVQDKIRTWTVEHFLKHTREQNDHA